MEWADRWGKGARARASRTASAARVASRAATWTMTTRLSSRLLLGHSHDATSWRNQAQAAPSPSVNPPASRLRTRRESRRWNARAAGARTSRGERGPRCATFVASALTSNLNSNLTAIDTRALASARIRPDSAVRASIPAIARRFRAVHLVLVLVARNLLQKQSYVKLCAHTIDQLAYFSKTFYL